MENEKLLQRAQTCPEAKSNLYSRNTLGFIWQYLKLGEIDKDHIPPQLPHRDSQYLYDQCYKLWEKESQKDKPSILRFTLDANRGHICKVVFATLLAGVWSIVSNWNQAYLIDWFDDHNQPWAYFNSSVDALILVGILMVNCLFTSFLYFWFEYQAVLLGEWFIRRRLRKLMDYFRVHCKDTACRSSIS